MDKCKMLNLYVFFFLSFFFQAKVILPKIVSLIYTTASLHKCWTYIWCCTFGALLIFILFVIIFTSFGKLLELMSNKSQLCSQQIFKRGKQSHRLHTQCLRDFQGTYSISGKGSPSAPEMLILEMPNGST